MYKLLCVKVSGCKGSENQASTARTPRKMKTPPAKNFFPCMSGMSLCPAFRHRLTSLWHQFFGTIALMEFVLKNPCQQLCSFSLAPCQRSYACPMAPGSETLAALGRTVFRTIALMIIDEICLENPCQQLCFSVCCFLPTELSQSYFPRFPIRPRCPYFFRLAPSQRSSPQAISHGFPSLPSRSFTTELSPSYFFPRFPVRPPCRRFHLAPSQPSSPQAISHGFPSVHDVHTSSVSLPPNGAPGFFPSVHPVVASISLLPQGALPKLFPTAAPPTTLSSLPSRSFPTELSPSFASTPCGLILEILNLETRWAREPESKTAHSTPFFEHVLVWAAVLWTKSM